MRLNTGSKGMVILFLLATAEAQQSDNTPQRLLSDAATQTQQKSVPVSREHLSRSIPARPLTTDEVIDRVILTERGLIKFLSSRTPIVETYLQTLTQNVELGPIPTDDRYFLGRLDLTDSIARKEYLRAKHESLERRFLNVITSKFSFRYEPLGFSWMIFADRNDFDRQHYDFHYVRREFVSDVRCLAFDITPKKGAGAGRFIGRIWVEDQDYNIVRLNGTYTHTSSNAFYFHLDSWRLNVVPGYWVPAYIYSEEGDFTAGANNTNVFKAQTRLWGYNLKKQTPQDELTAIRVDSVKDDTPAEQDASPVVAEREWERQAGNNVIERLQRAGLVALEGDASKVLETVVNNIEVTNNIDLPIQVRLLLTTPLEMFSVGNTIVVSRGLIDVLPDESSLAMVLSHELAHIILGHNVSSKYAFSDRMLFSDDTAYEHLNFRHTREEEASADQKAIELLKSSPYAENLDCAGLFIKALQTRATPLSALVKAHLGNGIIDNGAARMASLAASAPALDWNKMNQIAALPIGGRIKVNPWDDSVEIVKARPVNIISARDKMPFEVTPFYPRLSRYHSSELPQPGTTAAEMTDDRGNAPTN